MATENIGPRRNVLNTLMAVYDSTIVEDKNRVSVVTLALSTKDSMRLRTTWAGSKGDQQSDG